MLLDNWKFKIKVSTINRKNNIEHFTLINKSNAISIYATAKKYAFF